MFFQSQNSLIIITILLLPSIAMHLSINSGGLLLMERIQLNLMPDSSEILHYDTPGIPIFISKGLLSDYPEKRAVCHWHDDLEIIHVLSGSMNYFINGQTILLQPNDAILINSREMHYGFSHHNQDCTFVCILFNQSLLAACDSLYEDHITPFLTETDIPYVHLLSTRDTSSIQILSAIWNRKETHSTYYEFDIIGLLYSFFASILRLTDILICNQSAKLEPDVLALRKMVSFIRKHYTEVLSLDDIAHAANISRSKC